ncbi:MAG: inositol polyphosphate kinase family protein [Ignavibacteriales bacterium]
MRTKSEPVGKQSLNLILMAGHVGSFHKIAEGRKIAKKTNQREYEIYASPGDLREIIPAVERTSKDNQEVSDMGENVVIMQNLFYGIQAQSLVALDIKIGKNTASRAQLLESGEKSRVGAFFKEMKMKLYDRYTKSSTRGWRFIPVSDGNRAKIGRNSETFLRKQLDRISVDKDVVLRSIISQLDLIKKKMKQSQKTFIASSVLIVIDLQHPEDVHVKLIDLAHPIDVNNKLFQKNKENFNEGINSLITFFKIYAAE